MSGKIYITSFDALVGFEDSLGKFSEDVTDKIQIVGQILQSRLAEIENRCGELESETVYWENEYDSAGEDDDTDYFSYKRQEAEEKLQRIRNLQSQVEGSAENFARSARRVAVIADQRTIEARHFLRRKLKELEAYAMFQMDSAQGLTENLAGNSPVTTASTNNAQNQYTFSLSKNPIQDLEKIELPKGFKWIRLDEISDAELTDVLSEIDFKKVSYAEMRNGLERFEKEILPVLTKTPENSKPDYFEEIDLKNGDDYSNGKTKIFDVFFGSEFIKVERFAGDSNYESVINGRHRLKVAKDLGWKVIPAQVTEVDWSKNDSSR